MEVFAGDPEKNAVHILRELERSKSENADVLVFPELAVPGYLLGDMWEREAFLRECQYWSERIVAATGEAGMEATVVFGTVITEWGERGEDGRPRKYNGYVAARDGQALEHPALKKPYGIKTLLPNYREFEEHRHFYDTRRLALETGVPWQDLLAPFELPGRNGILRAGIVLCEDAWDEDYAQKPLQVLKAKGCDFVLNLSCSPFTQGKNGKRNSVFSAHAKSLACPLLYVNAIGVQNNGKTVFAFDGCGTAYDGKGKVRLALEAFEPSCGRVGFLRGKNGSLEFADSAADAGGVVKSGVATEDAAWQAEGMHETYAALRFGAARLLAELGVNKVVIGASGGIDSAVSAALYAAILPPENLLLVNMPSRHNSATTRELSRQLARNLGCLYAEVPIEDSVALTNAQIDGLRAASLDGKCETVLRLSDLALENVQARDRSGRILAAVAAAFGGVFTCNANKAELTVGYATLYGDLAGFFCLLGDLWKADVYSLGRYLNDSVFNSEAIPQGIFDVVPSAELSPRHNVDESKGDPLFYPYHDRLFRAFMQRWRRATPEEVLEWYLEGTLNSQLGCTVDAYAYFPGPAAFIEDLEKWWNLHCGLGVAKRIQAPPVMAVSSRAYGFDHREHQGRPFYSRRYRELKEKAMGIGPV